MKYPPSPLTPNDKLLNDSHHQSQQHSSQQSSNQDDNDTSNGLPTPSGSGNEKSSPIVEPLSTPPSPQSQTSNHSSRHPDHGSNDGNDVEHVSLYSMQDLLSFKQDLMNFNVNERDLAFKLINNSIDQLNYSEHFRHISNFNNFNSINSNLSKVEIQSIRRQAEALSWKLERSRWDARLTRWVDHDEIEPQGTSILQQDLESENRMLIGDKRVLKSKLDDALNKSAKLENELRSIRATLITKAHPPLDAWKHSSWHDGDSRSSHFGMGDARAEHLLLASRRLSSLVKRGQNNHASIDNQIQPKQISRRKAAQSASNSTPKSNSNSGLENLINAATSVFDNDGDQSPTKLSSSPFKSSPTKLTRPSSPTPNVFESPKRRRVPPQPLHKLQINNEENNEDKYLHYKSASPSSSNKKRTALDMLAGSALDVLADQAVEHGNQSDDSQNVNNNNNNYSLPPKLSGMDEEKQNELGPPLRLKQPSTSSPTLSSSPQLESPVKLKFQNYSPQTPTMIEHHPNATFSVPPSGFTSIRPSGPNNASRAPYTK